MAPIVKALQALSRATPRSKNRVRTRLMRCFIGWSICRTGSLSSMFRYITFRTGGAVITALLFVFLFGPYIIDRLRLFQGKGQPIRADGPKSHIISKAGTPTMGGLMILSGMLVSTLLWANPPTLCLGRAVGDARLRLVGFYDDYLKVKKQTHNGFAGRTRWHRSADRAERLPVRLVQLGATPFSTSLVFPFFKDLVLNLGWFFVLFAPSSSSAPATR
jgi:phospho-N-acetylmuramoyl-pentapeptide-transferase